MSPKEHMTRAERLKAARHALGLTDRQMAAALQLRGANAKDDLRKMEDGAREVTGPVLVAAELMVRVGFMQSGDAIAYLRDLDGTGSLHVCAKDDPGAFPVFGA